MFKDRSDAGMALGKALIAYRDSNAVVLALPRGGVPVAVEVAKILRAPLDLIVARKIGHPFHPEYAIGAVSEDGYEVYNEIERQRVDPAWLREEVARELEEARRRRNLYLAEREPLALETKIAILVDDGIATGYTMRAAVHSVVGRKPEKLIVAAPVAPPDVAERFDGNVDEIVILESPDDFRAIGPYYDDFSQVSDEDVTRLMKEAMPA